LICAEELPLVLSVFSARMVQIEKLVATMLLKLVFGRLA
jgi:hypothetical protein